MKDEHIIPLNGKKFITFAGLLDSFHENKGHTIRSVKLPDGTFKAIVEGERGIFEAHGDANESNVTKNLIPHIVRMAETRAIARALRLYTNIGMCSVEELGESVEDTYEDSKELEVEVPNVCSSCGIEIEDKVKEFSIKKFGKTLCFKCQRK